jgi:hypothetical protein
MSDSESRSFLDTGLDLSTESLSEDEKARLLAWYADAHIRDGTHLSRMPTFLIEHDPVGFKRYRRYILEIDREQDGVALPQAAHLLMFLYTYTVLGFGNGILYAAINARQLGASRGEVVDTLRLAALAAGPFGLDAAGGSTDSYLREWPRDSGEPGLDWPRGWRPRPDAFRSGIDLATAELGPGELELIEDWYRGTYGEAPEYVRVLARLHPSAYKAQRARFESALGETLPVEMAPLLMLHLAAMRLWTKPMLRSAQLARSLGVERQHVVATLFWAGMYADEMVMETAVDTLAPLLDSWDD